MGSVFEISNLKQFHISSNFKSAIAVLTSDF